MEKNWFQKTSTQHIKPQSYREWSVKKPWTTVKFSWNNAFGREVTFLGVNSKPPKTPPKSRYFWTTGKFSWFIDVNSVRFCEIWSVYRLKPFWVRTMADALARAAARAKRVSASVHADGNAQPRTTLFFVRRWGFWCFRSCYNISFKNALYYIWSLHYIIIKWVDSFLILL